MKKLHEISSLVIACVVSWFLVNSGHAEDQYKIFDEAKSPYLEIRTDGTYKKIKLPEIDDSDLYRLKNLNGNGLPEAEARYFMTDTLPLEETARQHST
jgi:hypothetical protein